MKNNNPKKKFPEKKLNDKYSNTIYQASIRSLHLLASSLKTFYQHNHQINYPTNTQTDNFSKKLSKVFTENIKNFQHQTSQKKSKLNFHKLCFFHHL